MSGEVEIYNPQDKPVEELPVIIGFNNGGSLGWLDAVAIAQDGTVLGSHICSDECFIPSDLGVLRGSRPDRHENNYRLHYPDGYRMEFVRNASVPDHALLQQAFAFNKLQPDTETAE